jgi:predicted transposase/invertase (TIGR01784 family)
MKRDDTLWKGILENLFDDFLRFFFPDADKLFDMKKGFEFLDKELEQLFPAPENMQSPKFVDKLVKVFTKAGNEEWFLVHIEIQGYDDKDFAKRMFVYFYRILDKYGKLVTAIAIFTDTNKKFKPDLYEYECLGTTATFHFNTYKIIEQDEATLTKSKNPFAMIVLTVLLALKSKKQTDEYLLGLKLRIARDLLDRNISPDKVRALMTFLKLYVNFANPETNANFEYKLSLITENRKTMGIEEMVLERARKKGLEKGLEEGMEKGLEKGLEKGIKKGRAEGLEKGKTEVVKNLLLKMAMTDAQAADIAEVSVDFVKKVRRKIKK